jgi:hypothetical protein
MNFRTVLTLFSCAFTSLELYRSEIGRPWNRYTEAGTQLQAYPWKEEEEVSTADSAI